MDWTVNDPIAGHNKTFDTNQSLSIEHLKLIFRELLDNDQAENTTRIFHSSIAGDLINRKLNNEYHQLNIISKFITKLKSNNSFDQDQFLELIIKDFYVLPLEIVWWLNKENIISFLVYCETVKPPDLAGSLQKLIQNDEKTYGMFNTELIVKDIISELLCGCYRPNLGVCRLECSRTWSTYCGQIIDNLIQETVQSVFSGNSQLYKQYLPFILQSSKTLPAVIAQRFCVTILDTLMKSQVDKTSLYEAYTYQELFRSDRIEDKLRYILEEIFSQFCTINDLLNIIQDKIDNINWKFVLSAVAVCSKKSTNGYKDGLSMATNVLISSFNGGGRIKVFVKSLLFIRQILMEDLTVTSYQSWYASRFGPQGSLKIIKTVPHFKFFMSTLLFLIPYEPKEYLKVHLDQGLSAPPKYNYLIHDYKRLCKARMMELTQSPSVVVEGVEINVLHLMEDTSRNEVLSHILVHIIKHQLKDYVKRIVPETRKNGLPFTKVHDMLLKRGYLDDELINSIDPSDEIVFDDKNDDEDFQA